MVQTCSIKNKWKRKRLLDIFVSEVKLYEEPNPKRNVLDVLASNLAVRVISQQMVGFSYVLTVHFLDMYQGICTDQ
jgi:hypothetical protein